MDHIGRVKQLEKIQLAIHHALDVAQFKYKKSFENSHVVSYRVDTSEDCITLK